MEKNAVKKRSLKQRILVQAMVILVCSMTISTVVSYIYFKQVVRNQKIAEEQTKLRQVSGQIEYMLEDIQNFARSIVVDESIQKELENKYPDTEFERIKKGDTISRRLAFYNGLRLFVGGSFLVEASGEAYGSVLSSQPDYLRKKLETEQIMEYLSHPEWTFSNPYAGIDSWEGWTMVCYRTKIMDKYTFGAPQGTLYLEINLKHFLEQVENYGMEYDSVYLLGNDDRVLYGKNEEGRISTLLAENPDCMEEGNHRMKEGYLLCEQVEGTGWELVTLISNRYLWQQSKYVLEFFFLSFAISIFAIMFTLSRQIENITRPLTRLSRQMELTSVDKLTCQETVHTGDEIQTLYECYNEMVEEIQRGIDQKMKYEKQKREMEYDIMLSQINPHYLYNVLNTVVYLSAAGRSKDVVRVANSLIFSLQETLRLGDGSMETTVEKELELTSCYLDIQRYRYPDMFETETIYEKSVLSYKVPKTIIQPLVENALLHGILQTEGKGKIRVELKEEENSLWISVRDDGIGISDEMLNAFLEKKEIVYEKNGRRHIGISNVRDRIEYLYGDPYGMWLRKLPEGGTEAVLRLPVRMQEQNEQEISS